MTHYEDTPTVAVYMVTYNHEQYIDQAIESVVLQKTSFPIRLFIGEDCSTDNTRAICQKWKENHPDKITLLESKTNLGINENATRVFQACVNSGAKYIALLEGDDFWTDTGKLEKQVYLLNTHPEAAGSFHNSFIEKKDGSVSILYKKLPLYIDQEMAISKYAPFHTSSFIFKSEYYCRPDWFKKIDSVDLAMYTLTAQFGPLLGINECMSHYRLHEGGHTSTPEHQHHFHERRILLHQYLRGKIQGDYQKKFQQLIDFHRSELNNARNAPSLLNIGWVGENSHKMDNSRYIQIALDGDVMPFQISKDEIIIYRQSYKRKWWQWNKKKWILQTLTKYFKRTPQIFYFQQMQSFQFLIEMIPNWIFPTILDFPTLAIPEHLKNRKNIIDISSLSPHPYTYEECVLPAFENVDKSEKNTIAFLVTNQEARKAFFLSPHPNFESLCIAISDPLMQHPRFLSSLKILIVIEPSGFTKKHWAQLNSQGVLVVMPASLAIHIQNNHEQKYTYHHKDDWIPLVKNILEDNLENIPFNPTPSLTEHCRVLNQLISNFPPNEY